MAYSKQTWTDDVSAVTGARMTHIEQGIYDNSLATDKINPSGTATTTAEIEEGQITDVIGFKSLKLKGQTSQYTTQGNNLLNIYARHPAGYTETVSGVTITYNDDGSISAKGTATADINYFLASKAINGDDVFNGTHYLSGCSGGSATTFYLQFWTDTVGTYQQTTTEVTTNKTAGVNWNITIGIKNGVTINKTFYPMMCATSGKSFEKYSGGKASPNPDFPQEVNNVSGDNVVGISNKNLIEYSFKGYNITSQGKFETDGTSLDFDVHIAKVKAGTTYTITPATNVIAYFDERPTITSQAYNNSREVITSTNRLTPTRSSYIAIRTATSNTAQLEKGTSATSFVAHQGNNFEINLGTIELCKIGTYQDYIFKRDGKWFKHNIIGSYTFDGSNDESWSLNSTGTYTKYQWSQALPDKYNVVDTPIYCDYLKQITVNEGNVRNIIGIANGLYPGYSIQMVVDISTLADFKVWLAENKPIVYYPLATPIEEEITYTPLIRQLDELYNSGLYDVTNISQDNSSEAFILDIEACKNNINGIVEYIRR